MSRKQKLEFVYRVVEAYNAKRDRPLPPVELVKYIKQKTGVRTETARDYISSLESGINVKGKLLKITLVGVGFIPWKE